MKAPVEEWGRRLSDAIRAAIAAGDVPAARRLAVTGDGQARSLATEHAYLSRGLGITARVLLEALRDTADRGESTRIGAARAELVSLMMQLAADVDAIAAGLDGATPVGDGEAPTMLGNACIAASRVVAAAQPRFESAQALLADGIVRALDAGDAQGALDLLDRKERAQYVPLRARLVRFMADTFAWVLRQHGPDALLRFHLAAAEAQRAGFEKWQAMPPAELAWTTAFLLKQHMGQVVVREDEQRFTIEQAPCGSGGALRVAGAYRGPAALPFVEVPGPLTFGDARLPVYCSHCAIWNALAPLRWFGRPLWVLERPARPDGSCTVCIYKRPDAVPIEYVERLAPRAAR